MEYQEKCKICDFYYHSGYGNTCDYCENFSSFRINPLYKNTTHVNKIISNNIKIKKLINNNNNNNNND